MDKSHKKPASAPDALELLKADHDKVKSLFRVFEDLRGNDDEDERKGELVDEICYELTMHTMIEDEIFYPVLRSVIEDDDMMDFGGGDDTISASELKTVNDVSTCSIFVFADLSLIYRSNPSYSYSNFSMPLYPDLSPLSRPQPFAQSPER